MAGFEIPDYFGPYETAMYIDSAHFDENIVNDSTFADLFHDAFFSSHLTTEEIQAARDELEEYMEDVYGIDFFEEWDWDWYREWYAEQ